MALIEGLILSVTVLYLLYKYGTKNFNHWKNKGVEYIKPWPFLGNSENIFLKNYSPSDNIIRYYDYSPNARFLGIYNCMQPNLLIRDLDLIKQITIKDFDHFTNRNALISAENEPLFGKNIVSLKDQKWREMRNTLSPVFTASKIKIMFQLVNNCGKQMVQYIDNLIGKQIDRKHPDGEVYETEFKSFFTKYANDVIATAAFGVQVDSMADEENEFFKMGSKLVTFKAFQILKLFVILMFPKIMKFLGITFFTKDVSSFFRNIVHGSIKTREEQNIVRPDLIQILMQARKGTLTDDNEQKIEAKKNLTDDDITSQAVLFFLGGFETTSTVLAFTANELAINADVQTKLYEEIENIIQEDGGKLTYDGVMNKMKYLDQVINESLRKWPPGFFSDRQVSKKYVIPKTEDSPEVTLDVGEIVMIPIFALHRDPKYFPDPDKFDPERFNEKNKTNIQPFTFMPFGNGPRNCIGMRFALMETKLCFVHLVRNFEFVVTSKTAVPLVLSPKHQVQLRPHNGFVFGLKRRV